MRFTLGLCFLLFSGWLFAAGEVETLSLMTTPVFLKNNEVRVSQGTGFYFRNNDQLFLVTAYHVLTGHAPSEKKEPMGNAISFYCHVDSSHPEKIRWINLKLLDGKSKGGRLPAPPKNGADIAVIPLQPEETVSCDITAAAQTWISNPADLPPGYAVLVVGYPYGYSDTVNALPVWKTGNLASSPGVDFDGLPLLLLDISIYPGMSGAPAIEVSRNAEGENRARLLGIFAGIVERKNDRVGSDLSGAEDPLMESLELAQVWKSSVLLELTRQRSTPPSP